MRVLLADDDRDLVDLLRYAFQREGYTVLVAYDGEAAWHSITADAPDLVILDMMMPKRDGMQVLKLLRDSRLTVPVIVLTALGDEDNIVSALQLGADDYVVKPFRPRELRARAQSLLRRNRERSGGPDKASAAIQAGALALDSSSREVTVDGAPVQLTRTEFNLLHYLLLNRNLVVNLGDIVANVWGYDAEENDEVVKVTVSRLRRKIEADPAQPRYIQTVPGVGYKLLVGTE